MPLRLGCRRRSAVDEAGHEVAHASGVFELVAAGAMISRVRSRSGKGTATNCITDMGDTTVGAFATAGADPFAASVSIRAWIVHWAS